MEGRLSPRLFSFMAGAATAHEPWGRAGSGVAAIAPHLLSASYTQGPGARSSHKPHLIPDFTGAFRKELAPEEKEHKGERKKGKGRS